jgi:DNA-binding transcriptional LysR family regulator
MRTLPLDCSMRDLRAFLVLAEELHFGEAAKRLGVAQPPLSQTIKRLETKLGCALFERHTRRTDLTEAGMALREATTRIMDELGRAVSDARRLDAGESGSLAVGFPTTVAVTILPKILRDFRDRNPRIELRLQEVPSMEQVERIRAGSLDLGFVNEPIARPELQSVSVQIEPFDLLLPAKHKLLRRRGPIPVEALSNEGFIMFPRKLGAAFNDRILAICQVGNFTPRVVQEALTWSTIAALVDANIGVSLVPTSLRRLRVGNVVYRSIIPSSVQTFTSVVWRAENRRPALLRFLESVKTAG